MKYSAGMLCCVMQLHGWLDKEWASEDEAASGPPQEHGLLMTRRP